jgi:cobalt-zinc-cadmium efflux system outer membrane protein
MKMNIRKLKIESRNWKVEIEKLKVENRNWKQEIGKLKVENRNWKQEIGKLKVESRNWEIENGKWKVERRKWKQEIGKLKMEIRKWTLEFLRQHFSISTPNSKISNFKFLFSNFSLQISNFYFKTSIINFLLSSFNFKPATLLVVLSLLLGTMAKAQVLSLDSVLSMIDRRNPMLQEYDNKVKALNEYSAGAKSWMAPMVGAGTFMTPYPNQMVMDERDKGAWMFSVEQEIPNPAKLNANKNYLQSRAGVEKQGRSIQFNTLRSEAKMYYYQWLVAEKKITVLNENTRIMNLMLKLARIRYPYNQGSLGNIYKAEGRLSEIENMLLMTRSDIEDKSFKLKALANLATTDTIMIDTTTIVDFKFEQFINDTISLGEQRSDIKQIDETINVMRLNQQLQQHQAKPDIKIRFDHMQPIGHMPTQFTAMAMISIPIAPWSSKMYKAEVKGMQYDIEAMKKGREAILAETRGMLTGMASQIRRMKQQLDNYEGKIIPALRKNYQTLMLAYEENREQLPIVIDGWEALNMAQMEYLNKTEDYYKMIVSYEKEVEK